MSYWIQDAGSKNSSLWRFFMCDYLSDIVNLPTANTEGQPQANDTVCKNKCCPGSQCYCLQDSSLWVLGKDTNAWIQKKNISAGSGEIIEAVNPIPNSTIKSLFYGTSY